MNAYIIVDVPAFQIGQETTIFFPDTMKITGTCHRPTYESQADCISRQTVINYVKSYIHEIISESGEDKNARTNRILRAIINSVETMPIVTPIRTYEDKWNDLYAQLTDLKDSLQPADNLKSADKALVNTKAGIVQDLLKAMDELEGIA